MWSTLLQALKRRLAPDTEEEPVDQFDQPLSVDEDDWFDRMDNEPTIEI